VQHFKDIGIYSTDLPQRVADDQRKFDLCAENGVNLFYLTFEDSYEDYPKQIALQAKEFGLDVAAIDFESVIDLSSAYIRIDRTDEFRALLATKNIKLLSKRWLTSDAKYSLECLDCGNLWSAQGNRFFNSRGVAGCKVCALKKVAGANRGSVKDLVEYAGTFGGKCLSPNYVQRLWVYKWSCAKGHVFEGNFNNMQFRNQFCPVCEGRTRRTKVTPEEVEASFIQSGLELLESPSGKKRVWLKVRCTVCGTISRQKFENLESGLQPCKSCDASKRAADAMRVMLQAGVSPSGPFVNSSTPWVGECLTCHNKVSPTLTNIKRGQGGCVRCGNQKAKRKTDSK
jgi:hypothetical protein